MSPTPLRALLVEDSEDDAILLLHELRRGGYEPEWERVETPETMKKALAGSSSWDVILSDYRMPRFEAPEALAVARSMGSDAPFIVVSGKVGEEAAVGILRAGAHDCVMKDNLARLCLAVERGIEEREARREREHTERRLRESEERYRAVIEQATDAIFLLDTGTRRIVEANAAFQKMFGYAAGEVTRIEIYDLVAHSRQNIDATIRRTLKERSRFVGERKYRRKDGSLVDVEVGVSVIFHGGRELICTICRDVTERKRNEEKVRASEAELRALFEAMDDPIFVIDGEGRHLEVAPTNASNLYRPPAEILGKTLHEVFPKEQADGFLGHVRRALSTRRKVVFEYGLTVGGEERWYEGTVSPMLEDSVVWVARDVTGRRESERTLRESEERFRTAFDSAAIGMGLVSPEGRWLRVNVPLCEITGYPEAELLGLTFRDITHPDDLERDLRMVDRVLRGEIRAYQLEKRYIRKDGEIVWILLSVALVRDDGGDPLYFVSQIQDITRRKHAEEALAHSERRLRTIIETEPECVHVLDMEGRLVEMNPAGLAMVEADSMEEVRGRLAYQTAAPEYRADYAALVQKALAGGSGTLEFEAVGLKGRHGWFETHAVPLRDARGEISGLLGITRDITERRLAEEALRQSEALYRTVIEQATENIFLVDIETRRIVESNPAFREALGYSADELRRMTLYDIVTADRESVDRNIARALEAGRSFVGERRYRRKDGTFLDVEASGSVILHDGRETLVAVAHDVTERARVQALLEERVATLSRIASDLTLSSTMEDTLDSMAESVVRASTAVACSVALIEDGSGLLRIEGSYGLPEGFARGIEAVWQDSRMRSIWRERSPTVEAVRSRRRVLAEDMRSRMLANPLYEPVHDALLDAPWDTVFIVPLVSRGRALGAINFAYLPGEEPGEDEQVFLSAVADQAAIAVENARLFAGARDKAALEERQRLARELHDSVSQALYGIVLGTRTARTLLERSPERASDPLDYVLSLAEAGLDEMRALIFELRPESLEKEGVVAALEKQAAALRSRHELEVESALCAEPEAPPAVKEAIYRIAQEALHNTVKHSRASSVEIEMQCDPEVIALEVSDDGVGFDTEGEFPGHLGLRSMRERASRLGGDLEVDSAPGRGTRVRARLPLR